MHNITLRPITQADTPFLLSLFVELRAVEFAFLPLAPEQRDALIDSQYRLQLQHYLTHYPNQDYQVVVCQGKPIGRLLLSRMPDELRIVDISLMASMRGQGLGTMLITHTLQLAKHSLLPVTLHVDIHNPAHSLYRKLGFEVTEQSGAQFLMIANQPTKSTNCT